MTEPQERCAELFRDITRTVVRSGVPLFPRISDPLATDVGPWVLWINPRGTWLQVDGVSVPPQAVYVKYKGAPVGVVHEHGGGFSPMGSDGTMDGLLKFLRVIEALHGVLNDGLRKYKLSRGLWRDV